MKTLDDINREIIELRRIVPDAALDQYGVAGTTADVDMAYNYATSAGKTLPKGGMMIGVFNVACPTGWTRVTALDDKFLRGAATYGGTGGSSSTHTHTCEAVVAHSHDAGTLTTASDGAHTHGYNYLSGNFYGEKGSGVTGRAGSESADTGGGGSHTHALAGNTASTGDASYSSGADAMLPPYIEVVLCSKD